MPEARWERGASPPDIAARCPYHIQVHGEKHVDVIRHSADFDGFHLILPRNSAKEGPKAVA